MSTLHLVFFFVGEGEKGFEEEKGGRGSRVWFASKAISREKKTGGGKTKRVVPFSSPFRYSPLSFDRIGAAVSFASEFSERAREEWTRSARAHGGEKKKRPRGPSEVPRGHSPNLNLSLSFSLSLSPPPSLSALSNNYNSSPQSLVVVLAAVSKVSHGPRDNAGELCVHGDERVPLDDVTDERHLVVEVVSPDLAHAQDVAVGRDRGQAVGYHAAARGGKKKTRPSGMEEEEEKGRRRRNEEEESLSFKPS